jgi:hypothetical protein
VPVVAKMPAPIGGPDAESRQMPLGQRAPEPAPFRNVILAVGDGLSQEKLIHCASPEK